MAVVKSPKNVKLKSLWLKNFKKKNSKQLSSNHISTEHRSVFKPLHDKNSTKGKDLIMLDYSLILWYNEINTPGEE